MKVQLVSKTQGVGKYAELNSEELVSAIARHGVIKEDEGKLIKYLMDSKHMSPLDMVNFTFENVSVAGSIVLYDRVSKKSV